MKTVVLMTSMTSKVWARLCGNLFPQFTILTGIVFLWITTIRLLETKSSLNSVLRSLNPRPRPKVKKWLNLPFVSSLPPPIPAKSQKEVNEISKYFKKNNNVNPTKSYTQASSSSKKTNTSSSAPVSDITRDTLKIKESFPNLPNAKIDLIQKVINGSNSKPKPRINMTMKGPSCKQVIIPISNDLSKKFIKDSSMYVININ